MPRHPIGVIQSILDAAERTRILGQHISLFEWVLFAVHEAVRVIMHTRARSIEVVQEYIPSLARDHRTVHVAFCRADLTFSTNEHNMDACHFVGLLDLEIGPQAILSDTTSVEAWALERGFGVVPTVSDGNCGIDWMACLTGESRSIGGWHRVRSKLASWTIALAGKQKWQDAFIVAGELDGYENLPVASRRAMALHALREGRISRLAKRRWKALPAERTSGSDPAVGTTAPGADAARAGDAAAVADAHGTDSAAGAVVATEATDGCPGAPELLAVSLDSEEVIRAIAWSAGLGWKKGQDPPKVAKLMLADLETPDVALILRSYRVAMEDSNVAQKTPKRVAMRPYRSSYITYRHWVGRTLDDWLRTPDGQAAQVARNYFPNVAPLLGWESTEPPPERVRNFWRRCRAEFLVYHGRGPGRPVGGAHGIAVGGRKRRTGAQGQPRRCEGIWAGLFAWFIDNRRFIKGRVGPRQLLPVARRLQQASMVAMAKQGLRQVPAKLNRNWFRDFRLWSGIGWRHCTSKFKISFKKYCARSRIFLFGLFVIRWFFVKAFGTDPRHEQNDQKGLQVNTAASKNKGTLELSAAHHVPILDDHAQSRERVSLMTSAFDYSTAEARGDAGPCRREPMEVLGRWTKPMLGRLRVPPGGRYSLQAGPKGSYRLEHVMKFMDRHLEEWSPARAKAVDYRIWGIDAYQVHNMDEVRAHAWDKGYIRWGSPGGTTDMWAVLDTDCHSWIDSEFEAWNTCNAQMQLRERPHKVPTVTPQSVVSAACSLWEAFPHSRTVDAFKTRGLSGSLDGKDDYLIQGKNKWLWEHPQVNGPAQRDKAEATVDAFLAQFTDRKEIEPEHIWQLVSYGMYDDDPECEGFTGTNRGEGCTKEPQPTRGAHGGMSVQQPRILPIVSM